MTDITIDLVGASERIGIGAARRAEAARDQAIAASTRLALTASTGTAIVATSIAGTPLTSYPDYMEVLVKLPGDYIQPVQGTIPSLKVDGGPEWGVYNEANGEPDASLFRRGAWVTVRSVPAFGGLWQVVSGTPAREVVRLVTTTGAEAPNAIVTIGDDRPWSSEVIYLLSLTADVTAQVPTLARDGLPALGLYDSQANFLPTGLLRIGRTFELVYSPSFGGVLKVLGAERPRGYADYNRGIVAAEEAKAGVRQLYRELHPMPTFAPITPQAPAFYENLFTSQTKCNEVEIAHGPLDSQLFPTIYDKLVYNSGGYGVMDCAGLGSDHNHLWPGPGMLNLPGIFKTTSAGGSIPAISDARNLRVMMELRASNLLLPPETRLALHMQMNDDAAGGTGGPVNFIYVERMIDEALGFGYSNAGGLGWPHLRTTPLTSGWATFTADLAPNDAFFQCIGTSIGRADTYRVAPVERALRGTFFDWIIIALHPQQDSPLSMPLQRLSGQLHIRRFTIQRPI